MFFTAAKTSLFRVFISRDFCYDKDQMPTLHTQKIAVWGGTSFFSALIIFTLVWTNTFLHDLSAGGLLSDSFIECERSIENLVGSIPCRVSPHFHSPLVESSAEDPSGSVAMLQTVTLLIVHQILTAALALRDLIPKRLFTSHRKILSASPPLYILKRALLI